MVQLELSGDFGDPAADAAKRLRIVVADDDEDTAITLATALRDEGHEVREAYRGDAVLALVADFRPDALLLDIGMPGMSGYELARTLRARFGHHCPLLIAVTGWKKTSERLLGQVVGFDHYVTKPYEIAELVDLLTPRFRGGAPAREAPELTRQQRVLLQAILLVGPETLAADLGVEQAELEAWIEGRAHVPDRYLLRLADVLVAFAAKLAER